MNKNTGTKQQRRWLIPPTPLSPPFPGTNIFTLSALRLIHSWNHLSCTFLFLFVDLAGQSNLLQALPRKPVTIFGQLHPGTPKPPLELPGWAPPGPLGLQGILRWILPRYLDGYRGHMGLTCLCHFSFSVFQISRWKLEASLLNVTPYDLERVGGRM